MSTSTIYKTVSQRVAIAVRVLAATAVLPERVAARPATRVAARLPARAPRPARPWVLLALMLAVGVGLGLTFIRKYHVPLDGDIAPIVGPRADYAHVLQDPFGWEALVHQRSYAGPNRFFAHLGMVLYFRHVPLALQAFLPPIDSLYAAVAGFNVLVQALLLYVLGWYASGTRRLSSLRLWLAMALMLPFFQTTGYYSQMGIIDNSATYNFFYALPLALLLVLLWPLYRAASQGQPVRLAWHQLAAMLLLSVVLAFNGPIITGTVLVLVLGAELHLVRQRLRCPAAEWLRGLPWQLVLLWAWLGALCLYSLYIGRYNSENLTTSMRTLSERYQLLPLGVFHALTDRLGLGLLVLGCLANVQLIRRLLPPTTLGVRMSGTLRWIGLFALVYSLLLPLGGYRPYRPYILNHDSVLPIIIALVGFYGLSASYLLLHLRGRAQRWYCVAALAIAFVYLNADRRLVPPDNNSRERQALAALAQAGPAPVVRLPVSCTVLSWQPITEPLSSVTCAELLAYWRVTPGLKLYYCPPAPEAAR
ncbi:MAG TPA: hypothetical protein VFO93_01555 [Hymenobacter sp.]|uniref:hypothetical protein n=1 Tax=Hymenobacter sp. TaxID=1898978 RepID=UPI002D803DA6|nr:hypothetical protein [Hymenobacter sp.]HET9502196.1 hypothetical protein [Hymenobacter sp.]